MKWFFKSLFCVMILVMCMTVSVYAYENNIVDENCHSMTEKWFGNSVELYSKNEIQLTIEKYFRIREESLTTQDEIVCQNISTDIMNTEFLRRQCFVDMQQRMNINITDAKSHISIGEITSDNDMNIVQVREWVFYDYDDLDVEGYSLNVAGFGVEHELVIQNNCIVEDRYDESDLTGICTSKVKITETSQVSLMNTNDAVSLFASMYSGYNPDDAAAYADKYTYEYNSAYYNFNSVGGDCANFTSQSIYAGGMPQVVGTAYGKDGWYYKTSSDRSATWTGAASLRTWMGNNRGNLINSPNASQIYKGSPVFYDWYNDGSWDHATICVGTNSEGTPIIDSHNSDKYHHKWNYGYSNTKHSTVQLTDKASTPPDTEAPTISNLRAENVSVDSFTIKCDLNDNVGVTRVWLNIYGPGGSNGYAVSASSGSFSHQINTSDYGGTGLYSVHVYAFDAAGNEAKAAVSDINTIGDTESPVITKLYSSNVNSNSFTINCEVYDNIAVTRAWIIVWGPGGNSGNGYSISVFNNFSHTINTADYGGRGLYSVHVYVYDAQGNGTVAAVNDINAVSDSEAPVMCTIRPTDVSDKSFTIKCDVYDNVAVTRAWVIVWGPGGNSGNGYSISVFNNFSHTITTSDYGGPGWYSVHVYIFDDDGNQSVGAINNFYVGNDYSAPVITNLNVSGISDSTFTINCSANEKIVRAWVYIMGPNKTEGYAVHLYDDSLMHTIETSKYGGAGSYEVHVYVWDTAGNESSGISTGRFVANKRFNVHFNANMGITTSSVQTVTYTDKYGSLPNASRNGYEFEGWYTSLSGGTLITKDSYVTINDTHTLYARWKPKQYYFDINGLLDNASNSSVLGYGSFDLYINGNCVGDDISDAYQLCDYGTSYEITDIKSSVGYSYNGSNGALKGTIVDTTNIELIFDKNQYEITFDSNGGTTSTESKSVTYDSTYGILPVPTREGHSFKGWYTEANGGTQITENSKVTITSNQTLYAQWQINEYTLTYNLNGGEGDINSGVYNYGTDAVITDIEPLKDGYVFLGWASDITAIKAEYRANDMYKIYDNTVLYAVWAPVTKIVSSLTKYSTYAMCNVKIDNINHDCTLVFAKYKGNKLVSSELRQYAGNEEIFPIFEDVDTVRIFAVDDVQMLKPICKSASLKID